MSTRKTPAHVLTAALALALCLAVAPALPGFAAPGGRHTARRAKLSSRVVTSSSTATVRTLSESLRPLAADGGSALVDVLVIQAKGTRPPASLRYPVKVRLRALGSVDVYAGKVPKSRLTKLATSKGVRFVSSNGTVKPPRLPDDPKLTAAALTAARKVQASRLAAATKSGAVKAWAAGFTAKGLRRRGAALPQAPSQGGALGGVLGLSAQSPGTPGSKYSSGWFDVRENHRSAYAWQKGWTGKGVKVALPDEGVDFAHPDLQGTEATTPAGPNAGWPLAFDPYSCYALASDQLYGTTNVRDGGTWFSNTEATVAVGPAVTFRAYKFRTDDLPGASKSGVVHIGYLNEANYFRFPINPDSSEYRPAVLVVDANVAGVYDTVYVDLDFNRDFGDDKPCTKESPISYLDFWDSARQTPYPDGFADLSGGMVYWLADGVTAPPGYELEFGSMPSTPSAGTMVAFMGALDMFGEHGTLCASAISGQGRVDGASYFDGPATVPGFKSPDTGGMVQGGGRDAGIVAIGDMYKNFQLSAMMSWDFAALGPDGDPDTGDESQIVSNSFGDWELSASEWDLMSRYIVALNRVYAPETTFLVATGNGGPGYGTVTAPRPTTGISVGASTQYGSIGSPADSAVTTDQITFGDVAPFSNRGPSAMGNAGVDVVADGSIASGDVPLNLAGADGWRAWASWAGTSRSCPTAAGNLALVYQAYRDAHGGDWPAWSTARGLLQNGATDCGYDSFAQGSGRVNAERSAELAAGTGGLLVSPSSMTPGSWHGVHYPGFASAIASGGSAPATLTVTNQSSSPVTVDVTPQVFERTSTETFTVTLDPSKMSPSRFDRPDWLSPDLSSSIPSGTELAVFRVVSPIERIDTGRGNAVCVVAYDWTDLDHDGTLFDDVNGNGYVNDPSALGPEIQVGEYVRFSYSSNFGPTAEVRVGKPGSRTHDGLFLGLQQTYRDGMLPVTVELSCWKRVDADGLVHLDSPASFALGAGASSEIQLTAHAPASLGTYQAQVTVSDGTTPTIVPVTINSIAGSAAFTFGGGDATSTLMPTGALFGQQDWTWRPETGDWRSFMTDIPTSTPLKPGAKWVVHTKWGAVPDDIDTQLWGPRLPFGPATDPVPGFFTDPAYTAFVGPVELTRTGASNNTNLGGGYWKFETGTGGSEEWVAGDLKPGLNLIQLHEVVSSGRSVDTTFTGSTGVMSIDPSASSLSTSALTGTYRIGLSSALDLSSFNGAGSGMSPIWDRFESISRYDYLEYPITLKGAAYLDVKTFTDRSDVDVYIEREDPSTGEPIGVGVAETGSGNESIHVAKPADGKYYVYVEPYDLPTGHDLVRLRVAAPQGTGFPVSGFATGTVSAGLETTATARWTLSRSTVDQRMATWEGVAGFGPGSANQLLTSVIDVTYPLSVSSSQPTKNATWQRFDPLKIQLSTRADPFTVTTQTAYLTRTASTTPVPATVTYDDASATVRVLGTSLLRQTHYTVHLTSGLHDHEGRPLKPWSLDFVTGTSQVDRFAGANRYDTAIKASQARFPSATAVVIASGTGYADALAASGLCGALKAPLLLHTGDMLSDANWEEVMRLEPTDVYIVGGTKAVSLWTEWDLEMFVEPGHVFRLAGPDRYSTAAEVARRVVALKGSAPKALITRGDGFPDALSAGAIAYDQAAPVLFVRPSSLPTPTAGVVATLGVDKAYLLGGTGSIDATVAAAIGDLVGASDVIRWAGSDRYATSVAAAEGATGLGWLTWSRPGLATGLDFPDGLTGGVASGASDGPLLLTKPATLPPSVASALSAHKSAIDIVTVYGGTGAVSDAVKNAAAQIIK